MNNTLNLLKRQITPQAVVDLYNLHLESGIRFAQPWQGTMEDFNRARLQVWVVRNGKFNLVDREEASSDEIFVKRVFPFTDGVPIRVVENVSWPSQTERERLIEFFAHHASPTVTRWLYGVELEEKMRREGRLDFTSKGPIGSLGWHEYNTGYPWWESKDFLDFSLDYWRLRACLDSVLTQGVIPGWFWSWYSRQIQEFRYSIVPISSNGHPINEREALSGIPLENTQFLETQRINLIRYGLALGDLFFRILVRELPVIFENPDKLRRCAGYHYPTPKVGRCLNIFWQTRSDKLFCSDRCRKRVQKFKGSISKYSNSSW